MPLTFDQMHEARAAMLSRVLSRLAYRRFTVHLPDATDRIRDRDADTRVLIASMLDTTPEALAVALDMLDASPARDAMDLATQARFILARIATD
jgi:hypothetical protein